MKKAIIILLVTGFCMLLGFYFYPLTTAEQAFHDFETTEHKESYIVTPLCNAGEKVVPIVIDKIQNKDMERRIYAIGFLGTGDYFQAIPILEQIVLYENETSGRANSLESLYLLDEARGIKLASKYSDRTDYLGEMSRDILNIENYQEYKKNYQNKICYPTD